MRTAGCRRRSAVRAACTCARRSGRALTARVATISALSPGRALSVTFLADGERACILGFNEQSFCAIGRCTLLLRGRGDVRGGAGPRARYAGAARSTGARHRAARSERTRFHAGWQTMCTCSKSIRGRPPRSSCTMPTIARGLVDWHVRSFARPLPEFTAALRTGRAARRAPTRSCLRACAACARCARFAGLVPGSAQWRARPFRRARQSVVFAEAQTAAIAQRLCRSGSVKCRLLLERWQADSTQRVRSLAECE